MNKKKIFPALLIVLFVMASVAGHAQVQIRHIYVFVDSVMYKKDSIMLLIRGGTQCGLSVGKKGTAIARYLKEYAKENYNEIGFGNITRINEEFSIFYMPQSATKKARPIQKNDLIKFELRPPGAGTLFTELAARGIIFFGPIQRTALRSYNHHSAR